MRCLALLGLLAAAAGGLAAPSPLNRPRLLDRAVSFLTVGWDGPTDSQVLVYNLVSSRTETHPPPQLPPER